MSTGGERLIDGSAASFTREDAGRLRRQLPPFRSPGWPRSGSARSSGSKTLRGREKLLARYRSFYRMADLADQDTFGYVTSTDRRVAVHRFASSWGTAPRRLVVLLHGYLGHSLTNVWTIRYLLDQGFDVVAFDLPGHGLSGGAPARISGFSEYADALDAVLDGACSDTPPEQTFAVGHSAGASVLLEHSCRAPERFARTVLVSPLLRSTAWWALKLGLPLVSIFAAESALQDAHSSIGQTFANYLRRDPLAPERFPLQWARRLIAWERGLHRRTTWPARTVLFQGLGDTAVRWQQNLHFLRSRIPALEETLIPAGGHCLLNDSAPVRAEVHRLLLDVLQRGTVATESADAAWPEPLGASS
jgi:alpha-beta hydrolase superfamily lysophospholipase